MNMNVLYSTDENYVRHAGVSILSLLHHNRNFKEIIIYIIENNLTDESKEKLFSIAEKYKNSKIVFISFEALCKRLKVGENSGLAPSGYARLFISVLDNVDKILYLDCDTVVNRPLEKLWMTSVEKYYLGGVQDNPAKYMVCAIGMDCNDRYINSGVLLINLKKWRESGVEQKFIDFIAKYRGEVPHHDQGIINGVCRGKILILEPKYNMMPQFLEFKERQIKQLFHIKKYYTQNELDEAGQNPFIIHYISKFYDRPWFEGCTHPMKNMYQKFLEKSPWDASLYPSKVNVGVKIRKFIFRHMPVSFYIFFEHFLNIKRQIHFKNKYKFLRRDCI